MSVIATRTGGRSYRDPAISFASPKQIEAAKIIYASLPDEATRRRAIVRNIAGKVPIAFVEAIDGRGWSDETANSHLSPQLLAQRLESQKMGRDWLATGAVACALTHRDRLMPQANSILCEDDAIFDRAFLDLIANGDAQQALDAIDGAVLLAYRSRTAIVAEKAAVARIGKYGLHRALSTTLASSGAYFLPQHVSEAIRNAQTPLSWSADSWDEFIRAGLMEHIYVIHPTPVRVGDFPSSINYGRTRTSGARRHLQRNKLLRRLRWAMMERRGAFHTRVSQWK